MIHALLTLFEPLRPQPLCSPDAITLTEPPNPYWPLHSYLSPTLPSPPLRIAVFSLSTPHLFAPFHCTITHCKKPFVWLHPWSYRAAPIPFRWRTASPSVVFSILTFTATQGWYIHDIIASHKIVSVKYRLVHSLEQNDVMNEWVSLSDLRAAGFLNSSYIYRLSCCVHCFSSPDA